MIQDPTLRSAIAALGDGIGPQVLEQCQALFQAEQWRMAQASAPLAADVQYGPHERHQLDLYAPQGATAGALAPVFVWVHGGGFSRGEKNSQTHPFNAHVGRWIAGHGFLGVVINYRLAPEHRWPSGGEDVALAIDWLKTNAARFGGDPQRIVLGGTSAGSVHNATYMQLRPQANEICGLVLLSGLYGLTWFESREREYFGDDPQLQASFRPCGAIADSSLPLFVACAQFDPRRFQTEALGLLREVLDARGKLPHAYVASGHNHYTLAMHLGTADTRLADEIVAFATQCVSLRGEAVASRST